MAINVTCPGCMQRFKVSDRFAGQKGPCPKCKAIIEIPKEDVVVHAPDDFGSGGRGKQGQLITKPLQRIALHYTNVEVTAIIAGILGCVIVTAILGKMQILSGLPILAAVGLLVVSPLYVLLVYPFLTPDEDLDPFMGRRLQIRAAVCGLAFAAVWLAFELAAAYSFTGVLIQWWIVIPFFLIAVLAAHGALDLTTPNAILLFTVYVVAIVLLRAMGDLGWVWNIVAATGGNAPPPPPVL